MILSHDYTVCFHIVEESVSKELMKGEYNKYKEVTIRGNSTNHKGFQEDSSQLMGKYQISVYEEG